MSAVAVRLTCLICGNRIFVGVFTSETVSNYSIQAHHCQFPRFSIEVTGEMPRPETLTNI